MKSISPSGWCFLLYGLAVCGYFSAATIGHWQAPEGEGTNSGGSSYGRSSGGSWGGGK